MNEVPAPGMPDAVKQLEISMGFLVGEVEESVVKEIEAALPPDCKYRIRVRHNDIVMVFWKYGNRITQAAVCKQGNTISFMIIGRNYRARALRIND